MSESKTIYQRLINFQAKMHVITKDKDVSMSGVSAKGNSYTTKYKYATLATVQQSIQNHLADNGLGYYQTTTDTGLQTVLFSVEGEKIEFIYPVNLVGKPQEIASAITYAKRYSLVAVLGLIVDDEEDDDGHTANNAANPKVNLTPVQQTQTQQSSSVDLSMIVMPYGKAKSDEAKQMGFTLVTINEQEAEACGLPCNPNYDKNGKKYVLQAPDQQTLNLLLDRSTMKAVNGFQFSRKCKFEITEIDQEPIDNEIVMPF